MAYLGVIFFANMGGGGGQNYFHLVKEISLSEHGSEGFSTVEVGV